MTVAQWHKAKMELLVLILLTKVCARGYGTPWHSSVLGARDLFSFFENFFAQKSHLQYKIPMPRHPKKSKYKSVVIKKKRYYFYKITWLDITGDSGHADLHTASGFMPSIMVTHAYLLNKDKKNVRTFASYEVNDELFSDRNVFPKGCVIKMEKINEK